MRYWNWVERLHVLLNDVKNTEFNYGSMNCGMFAAMCVDAIQQDAAVADYLRAQFTDEAGARAWVDAGGGIEARVTDKFGEPVAWHKATRGDLALVPTQDGPGVGVIMGTTIVMLAPKGITHIRVDTALKCWRVS